MLRADRTFVFVERREVAHVHAEDVLLDVVRERLDLVRRVLSCRHGEYLVEFFERERFRLGDEQQDGEEPEHVPAGVPAEGTLRRERAEQTREGDRNNEVAVNALSVNSWERRGGGTHKNQRTAVAKDIPTSRTYSGNASAE